MKRKLRRGCLILLVWTAILLLMLEGLLWAFDPLRFQIYMDINELWQHYIPGEFGYAPGEYEFRHWQVSINEDFTRAVPDTNERADCEIVVLGDSVTFGYGVNDADTYVNMLAQAFPEVRFVNTGVPGANSTHVLNVYRREFASADGFIYLMLQNDVLRTAPGATIDATREERVRWTWVSIYAVRLYRITTYNAVAAGEAPTPEQIAPLLTDAAVLASDDRVLLLTYGDLDFMKDIPHVVIDQPGEYIPAVDGHPNRRGYEKMAAQMQTYVAELINRVCD